MPGTGTLRLISWNVNNRVGRLDEQAAAISAHHPDLVALQEVTARTAPLWRAALAAHGLPHGADSFQLAPRPDRLAGPRRYGELVASRWPLAALPPEGFAIPWPERVLSATVASPWGAVEVHTTHVPPGSSNGWIKIETLEGIFARLARASAIPRLLCGDLNAPQVERADGEVVTWAQVIAGDGRARVRARRKGGSGAAWDRAERDVLTGLAAYDLADVYRRLHGYGRDGFSWYWRGNGQLVGRRFDHIFASAALGAVACDYLDALRAAGLSDHAPLLADFAPAIL